VWEILSASRLLSKILPSALRFGEISAKTAIVGVNMQFSTAEEVRFKDLSRIRPTNPMYKSLLVTPLKGSHTIDDSFSNGQDIIDSASKSWMPIEDQFPEEVDGNRRKRERDPIILGRCKLDDADVDDDDDLECDWGFDREAARERYWVGLDSLDAYVCAVASASTGVATAAVTSSPRSAFSSRTKPKESKRFVSMSFEIVEEEHIRCAPAPVRGGGVSMGVRVPACAPSTDAQPQPHRAHELGFGSVCYRGDVVGGSSSSSTSSSGGGGEGEEEGEGEGRREGDGDMMSRLTRRASTLSVDNS
jgi:hypothetical protein